MSNIQLVRQYIRQHRLNRLEEVDVKEAVRQLDAGESLDTVYRRLSHWQDDAVNESEQDGRASLMGE